MGSGVQHNGPIVLLAFGPRLFSHTAFQEHVFARFRPQSRPSTWNRRRQPLGLSLLAVNDAWRAQPYAGAPSTRRGQPELAGRFSSRGFRFPPLPLSLTTIVYALIYVCSCGCGGAAPQANVATGVVNLSMRTMYASDRRAMCVLGAYAFGVCASAWAMRGRRVWRL